MTAIEDREELRQLLQHEAFLIRNKDQQLRSRSGRTMGWMLYSWAITLQGRGAELAGKCLLDKLSTFESTQLASHGYAGLPLMSSCILLGGGKYRGLAIRETRKAYGVCRQIEGVGDVTTPVVVIDDCLVSGTSLHKAISALEAEGYRVEGTVSLVHIPWQGGKSWAEGLGYRVETVFDAWEELGAPLPPTRFASRTVQASKVSGDSSRTGRPHPLPPAESAREIATHYLSSGRIPPPPSGFDMEYDAPGGILVSLHDRATGTLVAWDGLVHTGEEKPDACQDLLTATIKTIDLALARQSLRQINLQNMRFSVTFLGPIEDVKPRLLDSIHYGVYVRSKLHRWKTGVALPDSRTRTSEIEQIQEARLMAGLYSGEPHLTCRFEVTRSMEDEIAPSGASPRGDEWDVDERIGKLLTNRVRSILKASETDAVLSAGDAIRSDLFPHSLRGAAVTLYHQRVVGCYVEWGDSIDDCLTRATILAWNDPRCTRHRDSVSADDLDIVVDLLHSVQTFESVTASDMSCRVRLGCDSLVVQQEGNVGIILAHVPCHFDWGKERLAAEVLTKAHALDIPSRWRTYSTAAWLDRHRQVYALRSGYPKRTARDDGKHGYLKSIELISAYIVAQIRNNQLPDYCYYPVYDKRIRSGTASASAVRVLLALTALLEAGRYLKRQDYSGIALNGIRHCLDCIAHDGVNPILAIPGLESSLGAECQLLTAVSGSSVLLSSFPQITGLATKIRSLFQSDGTVSDRPGGQRLGVDHDILPGQAIVSLARFARATGRSDLLPSGQLDACLARYRRRFRSLHRWLMIGWQMQAWSAVHGLSRAPEHAAFVFEMADWALDWQLRKNGAFLTDLHPEGPSFHTACVAEGIADAWTLARSIGDLEHSNLYEQSWRAAMGFMDELMIREEDTYCMPDPQSALGGVRPSHTSSTVRIDYAAHQLLAILKGIDNL